MTAWRRVPLRWLVQTAVLGIVLAGCERQPVGPARSEQPGPGEVWLTAQQLREARVEVAPVDEQPLVSSILTSGKVSFDDSRVAHVFSPISGRVLRVAAQLGQRVEQGDALAVIESPELGAASADVGKAKADLLAAEHEFQRQKGLFAQHAASERDYEKAEDDYRKAQAELARAEQKMRLLRGGAFDSVTQAYTLVAPLAGEVINRNVSAGMEVQGQYAGGTAAELFTIGELDPVWVLADLYEMDLARVRVGARAEVHSVTYPDRVLEGRVDWVSGFLDPVTRTAKVRCTLANSDRALKPEMYVSVQIAVEEARGLAVPRAAILRIGNQTVVFVEQGTLPDGRTRFARVPVTVDEEDSGPWAPVSHGLEKGQRVVTSGAILLAGML